MEGLIVFLESIVWSAPLVMLLMFTHLFFTCYLKFPQKYTWKGLRLMFVGEKGNSKKQGVSSFQSLMTVLAATLGVGNIVGVAAAISIGGIGSVFWIFVSGIFAIATKFVETYIVLKYRKKDQQGYFGGAMYVLRDRLGCNKLAVFFSIFVIVASFGGNMIQSNAMAASIVETFHMNPYVLATLVTVLSFYVIFGNAKRTANISSILVPIATIMYMAMCGYLLYLFRDNIIPSIISITKEALTFRAGASGIFASLAIRAMNAGLSKGLYSNEAGMGSSPLFNVTVVGDKTKKEEAIISSTSVFIDTVVLCSMTGLILVASGLCGKIINPITLTNTVFGYIPYGKYLLSFSLAIFAVATIPCWGYYGAMGIRFLFGNKNFYPFVYKLIYGSCVFLGAIATVQTVWSISSIANALMIFPNLYMLYQLRKEVET